MWTGNRQANRIRSRYLTSLLRQDISFFDVDSTTGGLMQGLNEDTTLLQHAMSEKVGHFLQVSLAPPLGLKGISICSSF